MFLSGRITIFLGLIVYVTTHDLNTDDVALEKERSQPVSLRGLKTGGNLAASSFVKVSGFKPQLTTTKKAKLKFKAKKPIKPASKAKFKPLGRKLFSSSETEKILKHHEHEDGSGEIRRQSVKTVITPAIVPLGRSLKKTDEEEAVTKPSNNLFGASLLSNPKKLKPIELGGGIKGRVFPEVEVKVGKQSGKKVEIPVDDVDESAEEATTPALETGKGRSGLFAASMIAPKEPEKNPGGRAFFEISGNRNMAGVLEKEEIFEDDKIDGRVADDFSEEESERKLSNSEKWVSNAPHSHNRSNNFPVDMSVIDMSQTDELFSCGDKRGTLSPIANNSKFFADSKLMYTYEEAKKLCMEKELVLAELMDLPDHWSIQGFLGSFGSSAFFNIESEKFFIGPNDIRKEGVFQRSDNGRGITFQNYHTSQPDDRNMSEDCTTVSKESKDGPVGASDDDCSKSYHVLCMFPLYSKCFNSSKEATAIFHMERNYSLHLVVNASERAYFVSNFQLSWPNAHDYCMNHSMTLYNLDAVTNMGFLRAMIRWETNLLQGIPAPPLQYWTSGKFKKTHMNAEVYWYHKPFLTESEERVLAKTSNFTFSGVFKWSNKKKKDPGAPYIWRRDLCLSFGFEGSPDPTPSVRNTNCEMPGYFICVEDYDTDGVSEEIE